MNVITTFSFLDKVGTKLDAECPIFRCFVHYSEISRDGSTKICFCANSTFGLPRVKFSGYSTEGIVHPVITDEQGRMIESFKIKGSHTFFDLSTFPTGKYLFTLRTTSEEKSFVILKIQ